MANMDKLVVNVDIDTSKFDAAVEKMKRAMGVREIEQVSYRLQNCLGPGYGRALTQMAEHERRALLEGVWNTAPLPGLDRVIQTGWERSNYCYTNGKLRYRKESEMTCCEKKKCLYEVNVVDPETGEIYPLQRVLALSRENAKFKALTKLNLTDPDVVRVFVSEIGCI